MHTKHKDLLSAKKPQDKIEANMPAVNVTPRPSTKPTNTGGSKSGITNQEMTDRSGVKQEYTSSEVQDLNKNAKPDKHGVTKTYVKGKDGKYTEKYTTAAGGHKKSTASLKAAWTKQMGKDAVYPGNSAAIKRMG